MVFCVAAALALTPEEQRSDIEIVRELVRFHPDHDDPEIAARIDDAVAAVPLEVDVPPHRFYGRLMTALAVLHDGHTDAIMDGQHLRDFFDEPRFLPYDAVVFEDELYLDPRFHAPARITSINGQTGAAIVAALRSAQVSDSLTPSTRDHEIDQYFANRYAEQWGFSDTYTVVLDDRDPIEVGGVLHSEVPYVGDPAPNHLVLEEDGLLYVTLNEVDGEGWRPFFKSLRRSLRSASSVVLDVRTCGGGFGPTEMDIVGLFASEAAAFRIERRVSAHYAESQPEDSGTHIIYEPDPTGAWRVREHLKDGMELTHLKPARRAFDGAVEVVIGPQTFSSCSNLATEFRNLREGTVLVGSETSGGARRLNAGQFEGRELPASGIYVQVPLVQMTSPESFGEIGRGVLPDVAIVDRPDTVEDEVEACARALSSGGRCGD
jgi:hypothetical protein